MLKYIADVFLSLGVAVFCGFVIPGKSCGGVVDIKMTAPILEKFGVSPDGKWVIVLAPAAGENLSSAVLAVPISGGVPRKICAGDCLSGWSSDGKFFFVAVSGGKTLVIPVPAGKSLPDLPASGISLDPYWAGQPRARVIERSAIAPGPDPSQYVFVKTELQRNLFRIPLH